MVRLELVFFIISGEHTHDGDTPPPCQPQRTDTFHLRHRQPLRCDITRCVSICKRRRGERREGIKIGYNWCRYSLLQVAYAKCIVNSCDLCLAIMCVPCCLLHWNASIHVLFVATKEITFHVKLNPYLIMHCTYLTCNRKQRCIWSGRRKHMNWLFARPQDTPIPFSSSPILSDILCSLESHYISLRKWCRSGFLLRQLASVLQFVCYWKH